MNHKNILPSAFLILFCFCIYTAEACKCAKVLFGKDSDNADLIFQGMVIGKHDSISIGKIFYTFRITKIWKGENSEEVIIKTNYGGQACGAFFEPGKEYVVFSNNLETTSCRRNAELSKCPDVARLDFKYIPSYREKIAIDSSPLLSKIESEYFNTIFNRIASPFNRFTDSLDFTNKNLVFFNHNSIISKQEFFERYGDKESIYFDKNSDYNPNSETSFYGITVTDRKMALSKKMKRKLFHQPQLNR